MVKDEYRDNYSNIEVEVPDTVSSEEHDDVTRKKV